MNDSAGDVTMQLLIAAHALEDRIDSALGELELSLAKLNVLSRMAEAGEPLTLSEIAARLNCVRSNVTQLIDRLEADGLVRREADADDRRSIRAVLTFKGRERQLAGATELAKVNGDFAASLQESERNALKGALSKLK